MKLNIVLFALTALTFAACSTHNPADPTPKSPATLQDKKPADQTAPAPVADGPATLEVIGSWHAPTDDQDGLKLDTTWTIADGVLTQKNSCTYKGKTAEAEASGKAVVDATTIDLQEALEKPAVIDAGDGGTVDCGVHLGKMKIDYEIKEGKLYFKKDGESTLVGDHKD